MKIGAYYYPEQWPREQWVRDFDRMAAMGLQIVHMGEFAWGTLEPREGDYQLDWLNECIGLAAKRKMDVILCTPTAIIPAWMADKHHDVFLTGHRFGGRRHANHLQPFVQDYSRKIVGKLAEWFGGNKSVIGWQIDNELASNNEFDQSPTTHAAFRDWLRGKYGSMDRLNEAWGTRFWNTFYSDWSQILLPPNREPRYGNPHQCLDASRFWSHGFAQFVKLQADILKPKIGNRWITTNFMYMHPDCDPGDMAESLSLYSWDAYPATGWEKNPKDENYRIASPRFLGCMHDIMASYTGRWGLMELQPGTINWTGVPILVHPGAVRLWIWTAFAHGAEFVTTYRFRQPRFGMELFHHGLIEPDGVTPTPGGREFAQTTGEMHKLDLKRIPAIHSEMDPERTIGIVFDFDQYWYFLSLPQAKRWNVGDFLQRWYGAAMRLGLQVRMLHPNKPWPKDLKMIVAPALQMLDEALTKRLDEFAKAGGHLLLTARTGLMNRDGHLWEGPTAQPIIDMIGARIEAYDSLPEGAVGHVEVIDGGKHTWNIWGDLLYAEDGTKVLAKYTDQFYAGATAATQRKHGEGVVSYSGVFGDQSYHDLLMEKLVRQTKLTATSLPDRVCVYKRGPYTICLNYTDKSITAPAARGAKFVVGMSKIEPAGVAVWEEPATVAKA